MLYITDSNNAAPAQEIQMRYELNIGLDVNGGDNSGSARSVRRYKAQMLLDQMCARVFATDTLGELAGADEPCLYADVLCSDGVALGNAISEALRQDCIAMAFLNDGALVGPRAAAWGEFNPEYFRRPAVAVAA